MIRVAMIVSILLCVVIGVPMVLLWWRDADRWADAEHKRFKPKPPKKHENVVVVTLPSTPARANPVDPGASPGIQSASRALPGPAGASEPSAGEPTAGEPPAGAQGSSAHGRAS